MGYGIVAIISANKLSSVEVPVPDKQTIKRTSFNMEPLRTTTDDGTNNFKHNNIIHSSRVVSTPLVGCDDQVFKRTIKQENIDSQVFNGHIKEEIIDEEDHHNDSQLLQIGTKTEKLNTIDTDIKTEIDFIDSYEFHGICINSELSNYSRRNPSTTENLSAASKLNVQTRTHTQEKQYECDICDQAFTLQQSLKRHGKIHIGEKAHKCDICNKAFSRTDSLKVHITTHTREKSYKCDFCDQAFSLQKNLKQHGKTHIGENVHKCDICNEAFPLKYTLKRHKMKHTQVKPYKCDICDLAFFRADSLKIHTRIHSGEKPYICDYCDRAFSVKHSLRRHISTHQRKTILMCHT